MPQNKRKSLLRLETATKIAGLLILAIVGTATADEPQEAPQLASDNGNDSATQAAVDTSHPRAKLVVASNNLAGRIAIQEPRFRKVGAFTQTQVTVQNRSSTRFVLEYKFDWHDDAWFATGQKTVWHRFTLSPNEMESFQSVGKTPDASRIVFTVRFPEDATIN